MLCFSGSEAEPVALPPDRGTGPRPSASEILMQMIVNFLPGWVVPAPGVVAKVTRLATPGVLHAAHVVGQDAVAPQD